MNVTTRSLHPLATLHALALTAGLALTALVATSATAAPNVWNGGGNRWSRSHAVVDGNVVDVQIRVDGSTAPLFFKPGAQDRHYFQAYRGRNYSLALRNTTGSRIGVLIAVDGLNVVNGQRSTLDRHEAMYVLDPWENTEIQGWRSSLDDVRRFVFVDEEHSYAERTGQANGDMGWIRLAAYREVERQTWWDQISRPRRYREDGRDNRSELDRPQGSRDQAGASPEAQNEPPPPSERGEMKSAAPKSSMNAQGFTRDEAPQAAPGTGWGDRRYDPVQQTSFEPQRWASDQITMRYEYASGLRALGIFPERPRVWERERGELGFAQPPRR